MSLRTVARNYARAFADTLPDAAALRRVEAELGQFAVAVTSDEGVRRYLAGPLVPLDRRREAVDVVLTAARASAELRRFVRLLVERHRMNLLGEIAAEFTAVAGERLGVVDAEVVSARPLSDELQERTRGTLARITGREVRAAFRVDPRILGGVRARVGSTVYDGSLRGRLQRLRARVAEG